jgi:hypothetical protein
MDEGRMVKQPRVLLFSHRNLAKHLAKEALFRCPHYEFEDIICEVDYVDMIAPGPGRWHDWRHANAKRIAWRLPLMLNPGVAAPKVSGSYDLFFTICGSPVDLLAVNALEGWQSLAKRSVCLVDELWVKELKLYKQFLKILAKFDRVILYYSESVKAVDDVIGPKCRFVPPGIDALLFCPPSDLPSRPVDFYSIGRRAATTHQALLKFSQEQDRFYIYDSVSGSHAKSAKEHRYLFATTAKRCRYFIVNPALVDLHDVRGGQNETGNRYYEGAAAGAIMIGERPNNAEFNKLFDWPDAVLDLPYGSGEIGKIVDAVESDHIWDETMRRNNVVNSLLRHDWAYRWQAILEAAELKPLQGLSDRKKRLECLAKEISVSETRCRY